MRKIFGIILILLNFSLIESAAQSNPDLIQIGLGSMTGISNNGQYICGSNHPAPPYIWSQPTGRIDLPVESYELFDISDNGIVVGRFSDSSLIINGTPVIRAGYWTNGNWTAFEGIDTVPPLDFQSFTHTYGISSDGSKAVGMVWLPNSRTQACYWSIPDTGIGLLEKVGGTLVGSRANAVSDDGSIIVGWNGGNPSPDRRPFYWNPEPHFIGAFDSTYDVSGDCFSISSNGNVIVGRQIWPFIWTEATGIQHILADPTQYWSGQAHGISDNGVIVGHVDFGFSNYHAFIKKPGWSDIVLIEDYLPDSLGITGYQNWYFAFSNAISADGNLIALTAYPQGQFQTYSFLLVLDTTVPVEFVSFTAEEIEKHILLSWSTATETNNVGFEIQRKAKNNDWTELDFISGSGTTTERQYYSYQDNSVSTGKYYYRLKQIDFDGSFSYSDIVEISINPKQYSLDQNYPNPFNPSTTIEFNIPEEGLVNLTVYNLLGQQITTLVNEVLQSGKHQINFNAADLASGIYLVKMSSGSFSDVIKINLLK